jgi:hypothetical protein
MIGDRIDANLEIEAEDSGCAPFDRCGTLGRMNQLFGAELTKVDRELVA